MRLTSQLADGLEAGDEGDERHRQRQRFAGQWHRAVAGVPSGGAFILRIDDENHASNLRGRTQAASSRSSQELAAEALSLPAEIRRKSCEPKTGDLMPGETAANYLGRVRIVQSTGREAVESKDGLAVRI